MKFTETSLKGCYEIQPRIISDNRGVFIKTFHADTFLQHNLNIDWKEDFYSLSKANTLRGLHFQTPPYAHEKLIYCISGKVLDVVVDLRRNSTSYGKHITIELSAEKANYLYVPIGFAHGFYTLTETATMIYKTSTEYMPENNMGILWNLANILWPTLEPLLSIRDQSFITLAEFNSPF